MAIAAIDPLFKGVFIPEAPFGLAGVHLDPLTATVVAVAIVAIIAFATGSAWSDRARRPGRSRPR